MTITDLNQYYDNLMAHLNGDQLFSVSNSDRAHNSAVMRFMFNNCSDINMFCGEMSVFRNGFYNHIDRDNQDDEVNLGSQLKDQLILAISNFLEQPNCKLKIIIANYSKKQFSDLISKQIFMMGAACGKIEFYSLDGRKILKESLRHCAYSNNGIVRMEEDQESHKGICSMHIGDDLLNLLDSNFKIMLGASERLVFPIN